MEHSKRMSVIPY